MGKVPGGGFTDACKQQLLNWNSRRLNHGLSDQSKDNVWGNRVEGFFKPPSQRQLKVLCQEFKLLHTCLLPCASNGRVDYSMCLGNQVILWHLVSTTSHFIHCNPLCKI